MICCKTGTWLDTTCDSDYEVSSCGRVRSWRKKGRYGGRLETHRPLKLRPDSHERPRVVINGQDRFVHHLVLEAFVGPRPKGTETCHGDGNPTNNHLSNLRWDTHLANEGDKEVHGTRVRGSRHGRAKLKPEQTKELRQALQQGELQQSLADRYGVSRSMISYIGTGKSWSHLSTDGCAAYSRRHARKLTRALTNQIKKQVRLGVRQIDIAAEFGIARSSVANIATGRRWVS